VVSIQTSDRTLTLTWPDGVRGSFAAVWLRDQCACGECRHPRNGQRFLDTASIPSDIGIEEAALGGTDTVEVSFLGGELHTSSFSLESLRMASAGWAPARRRAVLWGACLEGRMPTAAFSGISTDELELRDWLCGAASMGVALLHGVPRHRGAVAEVAGLFAHVRETNYGRVFDVRAVVDPTNLADTALALAVHTDNPYRDPTPTLQLLHCLASSADGGDTILVDGFNAVERLRKEAPAMLDVLAARPIRFAFRDPACDLVAEFPIVSLNHRGEPVAVHFNNRSKVGPAATTHEVEAWYDAYRSFARLLTSPDLEVRLRLQPGDLIMFDNTRVLHGRTGFAAGGERLLQGCYAERDGLLSRLGVLERRFGAGPR